MDNYRPLNLLASVFCMIAAINGLAKEDYYRVLIFICLAIVNAMLIKRNE